MNSLFWLDGNPARHFHRRARDGVVFIFREAVPGEALLFTRTTARSASAMGSDWLGPGKSEDRENAV